jgi:hypothetical protein
MPRQWLRRATGGEDTTVGWMVGEAEYNPHDSMTSFSMFTFTKGSGRHQFCNKPVDPSPGPARVLAKSGDGRLWRKFLGPFWD